MPTSQRIGVPKHKHVAGQHEKCPLSPGTCRKQVRGRLAVGSMRRLCDIDHVDPTAGIGRIPRDSRSISTSLRGVFRVGAIYLPILKWKRGEFAALRELSLPDKSKIIPMLELQDDTVDVDEDVAAVSGPTSFDRAAAQAMRAWGTTPFFIDGDELDQPVAAAPAPIERLFDACRRAGLAPIPGIGIGASTSHCQAVARIIASDKRGCAVRIGVEDLVASNIGSVVASLLATLGVSGPSVDLVLDWRAIGPGDAATTTLAAGAVIPTLPHLNSWRSVIFAASSFPQTLTAAGTGLSTIVRAEWLVYQRLLANRPGGARIAFGDYAIAHPIYAPAPFLGSASVRYTITDEWLIARGRTLKGPVHGGFSQFQGLCGQLITNPAYCGASFSWGDDYIARCSQGQVGTGNLTTWRSVGTNHHLTFVARQLASYGAPSNGLAPPTVGP